VRPKIFLSGERRITLLPQNPNLKGGVNSWFNMRGGPPTQGFKGRGGNSRPARLPIAGPCCPATVNILPVLQLTNKNESFKHLETTGGCGDRAPPPNFHTMAPRGPQQGPKGASLCISTSIPTIQTPATEPQKTNSFPGEFPPFPLPPKLAAERALVPGDQVGWLLVFRLRGNRSSCTWGWGAPLLDLRDRERHFWIFSGAPGVGEA